MIQWVTRYWPVIVGVILCVLSFAETRVSVFFNTQQLEAHADSNKAQWRKISDHETRISRLEGRQ